MVKFIYSENATKFCEISTLDLLLHRTNLRWRFGKKIVTFSEYMNFNFFSMLRSELLKFLLNTIDILPKPKVILKYLVPFFYDIDA